MLHVAVRLSRDWRWSIALREYGRASRGCIEREVAGTVDHSAGPSGQKSRSPRSHGRAAIRKDCDQPAPPTPQRAEAGEPHPPVDRRGDRTPVSNSSDRSRPAGSAVYLASVCMTHFASTAFRLTSAAYPSSTRSVRPGPIAGGRRPGRTHGRAAAAGCDQALWDFRPPSSRVIEWMRHLRVSCCDNTLWDSWR